MSSANYPLTQYSHGAGCGCKIAPAVLDEILQQATAQPTFTQLLVGNDKRDDAAVFDLGDGTAIISTTDFFMPIVDDAYDFGRIASVNAISDVYAMGGQPLLAIAILGWPIDKLPTSVANQVVEGGRAACAAAGIPLAGGHSIDSPEPIFGLAVTGRVFISHLKENAKARPGDQLFLTKPLGVGIYSTAQKKGKLRPEDATIARDSMVQLNRIGTLLGQQDYVHAMTDVTGFGLLGHLNEMTTASQCSAIVDFAQVPLLYREKLDYYLELGCIPGGTKRNWASYGHHIGELSDYQRHLLCDPQTSGGLLVAVAPDRVTDFLSLTREQGWDLNPIGQMVARKERHIYIE
ncbi:MAG: selenide, water dikinase SelD [Bacteroidetes bacterium]|nr:MAG: selenide, water dikinase SelD [Bacteroidota bacterium]